MARVLVTGGAGFIGSHLVDALIERGDDVIVVDNLSTGSVDNVKGHKSKFQFFNRNILDLDFLMDIMKGVEFVSHQAALASVPRSIADPIASNQVNVQGTLNVLWAAKENQVKRVVVASSSSIYGDTVVSPKNEKLEFKPKSPYALSKVATEEYARIFFEVYGLETIALRYFNIFGPRQSPNGPYAAVIPRFIDDFKQNQSPKINGDGSFSRDFTYVANAVSANLLSFVAPKESCGTAYNVGAGAETTILRLFEEIRGTLNSKLDPIFGPVREGDVAHSRADISKAESGLAYKVLVSFEEGIRLTVNA